MKVDLHCHSHCSDGSDAPLTLLHLAKKANLDGLSITDHDTLDAYTPELFEEAKKLSLHLLPGIELSSEMDQTAVHVLGYGIDLGDAPFRQFLIEMQERRHERNRQILQNLSRYKVHISEEELLRAAKTTVGRPHIAKLMVEKGYVATFQDAFNRYLKDGALAYAPGVKPTTLAAIGAIQKAKGKAILAHPHFFRKGLFLKKLLALPFDGVECYYAKLHKAQELPWLKIAQERNWIATGGSDYHGALKPHIPLGCSWVGEGAWQRLQNG